MAVIRCQACGKPNPDFLEVCQYCEARLKPPAAEEAPAPEIAPADQTLIAAGTQSVDCPVCGQPNPATQTTCRNCHAPLKTSGPAEAEAAPGLSKPASGSLRERLMRGAQPAEQPPPLPEAPPATEPETPGDWMSRLRAAHSGPADEPDWMWTGQTETPAAEPAGDDLPDWLRDLAPVTGATAAPETLTPPPAPEPPAAEPASSDEMPGWLKEAAPTVVPAGEPAADRPRRKMTDWLAAGQEPPSSDVPAWLQDLAPLAPAEGTPTPAQPAEEPGVPDWLKTLPSDAAGQQPPTAEGKPPTAAGRMAAPPPWMRPTAAEQAAAAELAGTQAPEPPSPQPLAPHLAPPTQGDAGTPDWLNQILAPPDKPEAEPPTKTAETPTAPGQAHPAGRKKMTDWLGSTPSGPEGAAPASAEAEVPEWLTVLSGGASAAGEEAIATVEPEELPDWLKGAGRLGEPPAEIPRAPEPTIAPAAEESLPEWLQAMRPEAPEAAELPGVPTDTSGEMPEWLATLAAGAQSAAAAEGPEPPAAAPPPGLPELDEETLAWLSQLSAAPPAEADAEAVLASPPGSGPLVGAGVEAAAETAEPPDLGETPVPVEVPAWMDELAAATAAAPTLPAAAAPVEPEPEIAPTPDAELPEWLKALRGMPVEEEAGTEELPEWLRALRGQAAAPPAEREPQPARFEAAEVQAPVEPEPAQPPAAEPAQLPAWLAAMRPVDLAQPAAPEAEVYEETLGVLAGMRGVLRAEPIVAQPHPAAAPVRRLEVSEAQSAHAKLLVDLLQTEIAPRPDRRGRSRLGALVERWVIFAVLAAAIGLAQFYWPALFPLPLGMTSEAQAAYEAVAAAGAWSGAPGTRPAPVLVAFEYEPALQSELNPGAQAIVRQVLGLGLPVVAVSSRPAGAAVSQQVLEATATSLGEQTGFRYSYGAHYLNLGFLPGGPVGLLQFAGGPRGAFQSDFTGTLRGEAVWETSALAGVNALADFGLIVVAADTPQAARAWVEQAQRYAPKVDLVVVASMGAEPLLRPYTQGDDNPQVDGLVAGLAGATQYEQHAGLPGAATERWPALGGGLLAAAVIIAAGNLMYGLLSLVRRRKR